MPIGRGMLECYLGCWTARQSCEGDTLGQVKEQKVRLARELSPATHVSKRVRRIHQLGRVTKLEGPDGNEDPDHQEGYQEAETDHVRAGPVLDGTRSGLVRVELLLILLLIVGCIVLRLLLLL